MPRRRYPQHVVEQREPGSSRPDSPCRQRPPRPAPSPVSGSRPASQRSSEVRRRRCGPAGRRPAANSSVGRRPRRGRRRRCVRGARKEEQPTRKSPVPTPVRTDGGFGSGGQRRSANLSAAVRLPDDEPLERRRRAARKRLSLTKSVGTLYSTAMAIIVPGRVGVAALAPVRLAGGSAFGAERRDQVQALVPVVVTGARDQVRHRAGAERCRGARGLMFRDKLGPYDGMLTLPGGPVSF